ncbi:hypothetical protein DP117_13440 [Brasilonema sp. UFV-L1]|nr:hypothetical protein [Brasilonema sp. UFV-L1]
MHESSEEYRQFIEKYNKFIEEYNKFLQNYGNSSRVLTAMKTSKPQNTQVAVLYDEALQAHIYATDAYIKTVAMYRELVQKWILLAKSCYKSGSFK